MKLAVAAGFVLLNFYIYNFMATEAVIPERERFEAMEHSAGKWRCEAPIRMSDDVERNLGVTDYHLCDWVRTETDPSVAPFVNFYAGYHATQVREEGGGAGENSIHPPAHCLPGSGWDLIHVETVELDLPGLPVSPAPVKRLQIAKGNARQLVYYWYQSRGRVQAQDWKKIVFVGFDRATTGRTDGALVRFTIPITGAGEETAEAAFRELAPLLVAQLPRFVPD